MTNHERDTDVSVAKNGRGRMRRFGSVGHRRGRHTRTQARRDGVAGKAQKAHRDGQERAVDDLHRVRVVLVVAEVVEHGL